MADDVLALAFLRVSFLVISFGWTVFTILSLMLARFVAIAILGVMFHCISRLLTILSTANEWPLSPSLSV